MFTLGATTHGTQQSTDETSSNNPNLGYQTNYLKPNSKHQEVNLDSSEYIVEENGGSFEQPTTPHKLNSLTSRTKQTLAQTLANSNFKEFTDELVFPIYSKRENLTASTTKPTETTTTTTSTTTVTTQSPSSSYDSPAQYEDIGDEDDTYSDNTEEYLITLTTHDHKDASSSSSSSAAVDKTTSSSVSPSVTTTITLTSTAPTTVTSNSSSVPEAADLCTDSEIDEITRTEWGNAFIFKG